MAIDGFEYTPGTGRVVFGTGSFANLASEIERLGCHSPILLISPRQLQHLGGSLPRHGSAPVKFAGVFDKAAMHTPLDVTNDALAYLEEVAADSIVSVGGGSTIGLGKALGLRTALPHICVPTTYAGSEMTSILGETRAGHKTTINDPRVVPQTVIYDSQLTIDLPPMTSAVSGINAIAHAVESLYADNTSPMVRMIALEGIKNLVRSLPVIVSDPSNADARSEAQYGAWLCGITLHLTHMGLHHKLCHALGGTLGLPHAETHTIVLPHALSYNAPETTSQLADLASVLPDSNGDAIHGLELLLHRLGVGRALKDLGMRQEDIVTATDAVMKAQYTHPRQLEKTAVFELIRRCWAGETARADF